VNLNESHLRKIDPSLYDQLIHAKEQEILRVAMTLNAEPSEVGKTMALPNLDPAQFPSRMDYRQALIQQQQAKLAKALSGTIQDLQNLSLKTYGGNTSRVIIAEGTAEQIMKSLELTGVHHASFDQLIEIAPTLPSEETIKSAEYLTEIVINILSTSKIESISDQKLSLVEQLISKIRNDNIPDKLSFLKSIKKYVEKYKNLYGRLKLLGMHNFIELESVYTDVRFLDNDDIHRFTSLQNLEKAYQEQHKRRFNSKSTQKQNGVEIANQEQFLMVLGAPGAGKSTFLRRIGLESLKKNKSTFKHQCIPILIELKSADKNAISLIKLIINCFDDSGFPASEDFIKKALDQGRLLILLDGLDEVPALNRRKVVNEVINFVRTYQKNRYIFSCRTAAYRQEFSGFTNVTMAEFEDDQIQQFIYNWFQSEVDRQANTAERCWEILQQTEQIGAKELAHTPLLLTFLCLVYGRAQNFPINRSILYGKALRILMEEWAAEKRILQDAIYQGLSTELEEILLSEIAVAGFKNGQIFFSKSYLIEKIKVFLANNLNASKELDGEAVLNAIVIQQGILVEQADNAYSFSHLTLQEYLIAQYIKEHNGIEELVNDSLIDRRWREVFLLVSGLMREGADQLLLMMEKQAQTCVDCSDVKKPKKIINRFIRVKSQDKSNIHALLKWADTVTANSSNNNYRAAANRAASVFFALRGRFFRSYDGNSFDGRGLFRDPEIRSAQNHILNFINALDINLNNIYQYVPEFDTSNCLEESIRVARNHQELKIFKPQIYKELIMEVESLKYIPLPSQENTLNNRVQNTWINSLRISPKMLILSTKEIVALENYFYIYELIVRCKKSALQVSTEIWPEIEKRMII
jgi:GTPase SAR1 family protein